MKTIKIKAYTFDELSKEAKERAVEEHREINVNYEWWGFILDEWKQKLESLGYQKPEIYFSGFWSQGGGACFTASVNILKWIEKHKAKTRFRKLYQEIESGAWAEIKIIHQSHYYYSTSTVIECGGHEELSEKAYKQLEEIADWIGEERERLGNKIYKELEKVYNYLLSDEAVIDTIRVNDYLFLENGSRSFCLN